MIYRFAALHLVLLALMSPVASADIVVDFETAQVGMLVEEWVEQDVVFTSTVRFGLLSFHSLVPGHMGMFDALADIDVPVQAVFPSDALSVTVIFWGSFGNTAFLKAYDKGGALVDQASAPVPQDLGQPVELFSLTVDAPNIAFIRFHGATHDGFITADEVHITLVPAPAAAVPLLLAGIGVRRRRRTCR